jgi:hypothetical protein
MEKKIILILFMVACWLEASLQGITRGAQSGEIYMAAPWFVDHNGTHFAIFYSNDNGENITLKYSNVENQPGAMQVGGIIGDATSGTLYNIALNELWVSFDYGENWEFLENFGTAGYAAGFSAGEIFRRSNYNLYRSVNYGETFELIVESLAAPLSDVGNTEGELYGFTGSAGVGYNLFYSTDYGNNFTLIPIDSTVAFWAPAGHFPRISRGTQPGEVFLVSWWAPQNYKIFHSIDTGYSWSQKYESDYIYFIWAINYSAGSEPGSFYVMRNRPNPQFTHNWMYIDYSSDYGESFNTYFHDLDPLTISAKSISKTEVELSASPNPFADKTTIQFTLPGHAGDGMLYIRDMHGKLVRQYDVSGKQRIQWDARNSHGHCVPQGLYFYNIQSGNTISGFKKLLLIH